MQWIINYSQIKWQLGLVLQVVVQDLRYENLFLEISNAFLRKDCTISMRILESLVVVLCISKSLYLSLLVFFVKFLRILMHLFLAFLKIFVDLEKYLWIICWLSKFLNWQFESLLLYSLRSLKGFVKFSSLLLQLSVISKASFCKKLLLISNPFLKIFWLLKIWICLLFWLILWLLII